MITIQEKINYLRSKYILKQDKITGNSIKITNHISFNINLHENDHTIEDFKNRIYHKIKYNALPLTTPIISVNDRGLNFIGFMLIMLVLQYLENVYI